MLNTVDPHKKFKGPQNGFFMKGLCQVCHSSNVEVTVESGSPICLECNKKTIQK